jgi:hypothetical protein
MPHARFLLVLVLAAAAPTASWSQVEDWHVKVRARAGLPASSARGQVRIFSEGWLSGGGETSLVARRDGKGRWSVSRVTRFFRSTQERHWRLSASEGAALEVLLDDPATVVETPAPPGQDNCLDPPSTDLEIRWRGRMERISQTCGPWGSVKRVQTLLTAGRD